MEIAGRHDEICDDPEPRVRFRAFGNSGLDFELLVWIDEPVLRGRLSDALNCEVYKEFGVRGIEIPFPKHDVHVERPAAELRGRAELHEAAQLAPTPWIIAAAYSAISSSSTSKISAAPGPIFGPAPRMP